MKTTTFVFGWFASFLYSWRRWRLCIFLGYLIGCKCRTQTRYIRQFWLRNDLFSFFVEWRAAIFSFHLGRRRLAKCVRYNVSRNASAAPGSSHFEGTANAANLNSHQDSVGVLFFRSRAEIHRISAIFLYAPDTFPAHQQFAVCILWRVNVQNRLVAIFYPNAQAHYCRRHSTRPVRAVPFAGAHRADILLKLDVKFCVVVAVNFPIPSGVVVPGFGCRCGSRVILLIPSQFTVRPHFMANMIFARITVIRFVLSFHLPRRHYLRSSGMSDQKSMGGESHDKLIKF